MSTLKPKERIWSISYSELCLDFCHENSYRKSSNLLNKVLRRSSEDSLKVSTLVDFTERVGDQIEEHLLSVSEKVLNNLHSELETTQVEDETSTSDMVVMPELTIEQELWEDEIAKKVVEINAHREEREQIKDLKSLPYMESPLEKCCFISIDDIGVKHQKDTRKNGGTKTAKNVLNTVIHIQNEGGNYYLTASSIDKAFRILLGFLHSNDLIKDHILVFFADGAQNIRNFIEKYFSFHRHTLILDWYHLKKKCKELISSALNGTIEQKKEYVKSLLRILWVTSRKEFSISRDLMQRKLRVTIG